MASLKEFTKSFDKDRELMVKDIMQAENLSRSQAEERYDALRGIAIESAYANGNIQDER